MSTKKIVFCCGVVALLVSPVLAYQYWEELLQLMGIHVLQPQPEHVNRGLRTFSVLFRVANKTTLVRTHSWHFIHSGRFSEIRRVAWQEPRY